jgi:hypothetical protein
MTGPERGVQSGGLRTNRTNPVGTIQGSDPHLQRALGPPKRIAGRHCLQNTESEFHKTVGVQRDAKSAALSSSEYTQFAQVETKEPRFPALNAGNAVLAISTSVHDRI